MWSKYKESNIRLGVQTVDTESEPPVGRSARPTAWSGGTLHNPFVFVVLLIVVILYNFLCDDLDSGSFRDGFGAGNGRSDHGSGTSDTFSVGGGGNGDGLDDSSDFWLNDFLHYFLYDWDFSVL